MKTIIILREVFKINEKQSSTQEFAVSVELTVAVALGSGSEIVIASGLLNNAK